MTALMLMTYLEQADTPIWNEHMSFRVVDLRDSVTVDLRNGRALFEKDDEKATVEKSLGMRTYPILACFLLQNEFWGCLGIEVRRQKKETT